MESAGVQVSGCEERKDFVKATNVESTAIMSAVESDENTMWRR